MLIFNELQTAFPWYDDIRKMNRYKPNTEDLCDFKLITPRNALLPFELRRATVKQIPDEWKIYNANTDEVVADISASLSLVKYRSLGDFDYIYYNGAAIAGLNLDYGFYYSAITFADSPAVFSEMFHVPAQRFAVGDSNLQFLKLEWYNSTDLNPFFYGDQTGGVPYFRNVVYLDTFIHVSEPEIEEDGTKDGADEVVATFQKMIVRYRITALVPDYLKIALVAMQLHDKKFITDFGGIRSGEITNLTSNTTTEQGGALSTVDLIFVQDLLIIKTNCPESPGVDTGTVGWS